MKTLFYLSAALMLSFAMMSATVAVPVGATHISA